MKNENLSLQELIIQKIEITSQIGQAEGNEKEQLISKAREISEKIKTFDTKKIQMHQEQKQQQKQHQKSGKNRVEMRCGCGNLYESSLKMRVPFAFCKDCRKEREDDIIKKIEEKLRTLPMYKADLRLDLHNTLNTIAPTTELPTKSACCISYVGKFIVTRIQAMQEIRERMDAGQIKFGVLVFKRASNRDSPEIKNRFTEIGSKAWFNKILPAEDESKKLFIDDSEDHVESVRSIGVHSVQINPGESLLSLITENQIK